MDLDLRPALSHPELMAKPVAAALAGWRAGSGDVTDCAAGTLRAYSWLEPNWAMLAGTPARDPLRDRRACSVPFRWRR